MDTYTTKRSTLTEAPFAECVEAMTLLNDLIEMADARYDGHLTILKFTSNWRVGFVTPNSRADVSELAPGKTFVAAGRTALEQAWTDCARWDAPSAAVS